MNIKTMIEEVLESSKKINELKENIQIEEKYLEGINKKMKISAELSKLTQVGTQEQRIGLDSASKAVETLNAEVLIMADTISIIVESAQKLTKDAEILMEKARQATMEEV